MAQALPLFKLLLCQAAAAGAGKLWRVAQDRIHSRDAPLGSVHIEVRYSMLKQCASD
jgi:hypothetical protein